jgi:large subunit ribosomal protein L27
MAHTKAGGSTRQKGNRAGRRLGVKIFSGAKVNSGNIIIRQKGSTVLPGSGVRMGRDFTIYSVIAGIVKYSTRLGRRMVSVITS